MKNLNQFQNIWTDASTDSLLLGCGTRPMQYTQCRGQYSDRHLHVYHQLLPDGYHARWLASHALSPSKDPCSGKPALETGEVLGFSESRGFLSPSLMTFPFKRASFGSCLQPSSRSFQWYVQPISLYHFSPASPILLRAVGIHLFGPKWCLFPFQTHKEAS